MPRPPLALALALLAIAAEARAEDVEDLIRRALELRRAGRDAEALGVLEGAWRASPSPRVRAQMGFAEQALGRWLEADAHLREALDAPDAWVSERRAIVEDALRVVGRYVGWFDVRCAAPGATLSVDGRAAGPLPLAAPLRVLAGAVRYEVTAEGYAPTRRTTAVSAGALTRDEVVLVSANAAGAPRGQGFWGPQRTVALVTSAGAAAGLGVGAALLLSRNAAAARWNDPACLRGGLTRAENCEADRVAAETAGAVSAAGFAAGGALALTAAMLWITAPAARRELALTCAPDANARGVACGGRF